MAFSSEQEFKQFYDHTFPIIRMYLSAKCGDVALAEDLAQEAFVRLWNNRNKVEIEKAKSFLFTVGNNLFWTMLDIIRLKIIIVLHFQYNKTIAIRSI